MSSKETRDFHKILEEDPFEDHTPNHEQKLQMRPFQSEFQDEFKEKEERRSVSELKPKTETGQEDLSVYQGLVDQFMSCSADKLAKLLVMIDLKHFIKVKPIDLFPTRLIDKSKRKSDSIYKSYVDRFNGFTQFLKYWF